MLTEITGHEEEWVDFESKTISQLIEKLSSKYPQLKNMDFQVASGQRITALDNEIDSEEIALLPPFSGG